MKRAETFWQAMVLFLVLLMTVGIYCILTVALHRLREARGVVGSAAASRSSDVLQIVEPLDGAILQRSPAVLVRAALLKSGFLQAELQVDGRGLAVQINPDPKAAPWIGQWIWEEVGQGAHVLAVQARTLDGDLKTSAPVTVTVVPTGTLVFASNRDGAYAIYAMQTDGRNLVRLTSGPGDARQPALRPEGGLAFVAESETGQAMIRRMGEGEQGDTDLFAGRDPAWSPDSTRLAFAASLEGVSQVFTAVARSGAPVPVTVEEIYAGQPAWSPDGARLAYAAERQGNWDIWVVALDGGEPRRLTDDPATDWSPAWSPDGSRLAFVSDRGGSYQIYVMRTNGSDVRPLTSFPRGVEAPAWSPDGFWLAFVAYTGQGTGINAREIYLMRTDGQNQVRLTHDSFDDTEPKWARGP